MLRYVSSAGSGVSMELCINVNFRVNFISRTTSVLRDVKLTWNYMGTRPALV